ncbi:unnamed protein product [Candidula unifasciata]|uniref:CREB/ATF bZIP transcription factor n=1 Tax=Candidula unifasciata TaxID=100452 RepID=A0A8S4A309_9EUPU|nr:unnamed protein product [Candidula unifasciata]
MDWVDPKKELIHDILTREDVEENYFAAEEKEDFPSVFCSGGLTALSDTARSCELDSPEEEKLDNISAFNCDNNKTEQSFGDLHFVENIFQLSNLGSDSVDLLSPSQFNDSDTEWMLSEYEGSDLKKTKLAGTGHEKRMVNSAKQGSYGSRRSYCLGNSNSKNAVAARDNRLKKKKYVEDLEKTVSNLQVENECLREQSKKNSHTLGVLQNEVSYLRKVIANQSTLSAILKNVMKTPGITLTTSFKNAASYNSSEEDKLHSDLSSCNKNGNNNKKDRSCKKKDIHCVDTPEQVDSVFDLKSASSTNSRRASKRNVKGKMMHTQSQKKEAVAQENKQPADVTKNNETFEDSDASHISMDNIHGGICLHVSGHNVSLEFCPLCNKNAYLGLITDHSYVKL